MVVVFPGFWGGFFGCEFFGVGLIGWLDAVLVVF